MKYVKTFESFSAAYNLIGPDDRIIMSSAVKIVPKTVKQDQNRSWTWKPLGLWYGIGTSWIDWVESDMPEWKKEHIHRIEINYSNVLRLNVDMQQKQFEDKYGIVEKGETVIYKIDWEAVEKDGWWGIEIIDPWGDVGSWIRTWDVSSGCIWDKRAIKKIEKIS
jgi:hypothetical protein